MKSPRDEAIERADALQELKDAARALLGDIEAMKDGPESFGMAEDAVDWLTEGYSVKWPNLALSAERLQEALDRVMELGE